MQKEIGNFTLLHMPGDGKVPVFLDSLIQFKVLASIPQNIKNRIAM
jgi:hypothetical protein